MLRVMMVYAPEKRPNAHLLLQHPYFENITENRCSIKASGQTWQADNLICPPQAASAAVCLAYDE